MVSALTACQPGPARSAEVLFSQAETARAAGHCERAVSIYQSVLSADPKYLRAYTQMASCYQVLGDFAQSRDALNEAERMSPRNYQVYVVRALIEQAEGLRTQGIADALSAAQYAGKTPSRYADIAQILDGLGAEEDAVTETSVAIRLAPDAVGYYVARAGFERKLSRFSDAERDYLAAAAKSRSRSDASAALASDAAMLANDQHEYDEAARVQKEALQRLPSDSDLWIGLGNYDTSRRNYSDALEDYLHARDIAALKGQRSRAEAAFSALNNQLLAAKRTK